MQDHDYQPYSDAVRDRKRSFFSRFRRNNTESYRTSVDKPVTSADFQELTGLSEEEFADHLFSIRKYAEREVIDGTSEKPEEKKELRPVRELLSWKNIQQEIDLIDEQLSGPKEKDTEPTPPHTTVSDKATVFDELNTNYQQHIKLNQETDKSYQAIVENAPATATLTLELEEKTSAKRAQFREHYHHFLWAGLGLIGLSVIGFIVFWQIAARFDWDFFSIPFALVIIAMLYPATATRFSTKEQEGKPLFFIGKGWAWAGAGLAAFLGFFLTYTSSEDTSLIEPTTLLFSLFLAICMALLMLGNLIGILNLVKHYQLGTATKSEVQKAKEKHTAAERIRSEKQALVIQTLDDHKQEVKARRQELFQWQEDYLFNFLMTRKRLCLKIQARMEYLYDLVMAADNHLLEK